MIRQRKVRGVLVLSDSYLLINDKSKKRLHVCFNLGEMENKENRKRGELRIWDQIPNLLVIDPVKRLKDQPLD